MENLESYTLGPLFLKVRCDADSLSEFTDIAISVLKDVLIDDARKNQFRGFFSNHLFILINENTDTHFLFEEIHNAAVLAQPYVDTSVIISTVNETAVVYLRTSAMRISLLRGRVLV